MWNRNPRQPWGHHAGTLQETPTTTPVPSLEADLRRAREGKGLSLADIQQETRIPVDVLKRFEEGDLIGDPTYNEVYLKAFLQSYAKAVGIPTAAVLRAHGQGASYDGSLAPDYDGPVPAETSATPPPADAPALTPSASTPQANPPAAKAPTPAEGAPPPPRRSATPAAVEALASAPDPEQQRRRAAEEKPKTLAQARVNRPAVPTAKRSFDKNWGTILGLFAVVVAVLGAAMYFLVFAGDDEPDQPDTVVVSEDGDETEVDTVATGAGAAAGGPQFQTPISVTVTAGGDGLQWFRVTSDGGERLPNWIDAGSSQTFEADSSLVLWGEGNDAGPAYAFEETTVTLQGIRFTPPSGAPLRLDAQRGQAVLDSLAAAGVGNAPAAAPAAEAAPLDPSAVE